MRDDMYEGKWSPFDLKWYNKAFDKFISGGDELFNINEIIKEGYRVPDVDGSKSSVFRNDAVLNNTFSEDVLKETLFDIYNNSSHKLIASNHDNVHFFQYHCNYEDLNHETNSDFVTLRLLTDDIIKPGERDRFKLSGYITKWISITDILNDWETFKWNCLVFVNGRVCSEYYFHIDDKHTEIRIPYYQFWKENNYRVDVYKFDTNASCRIKISKELVINQWNWKMPVDYIGNNRIGSSTKLLSTINKISDTNIRKDGNDKVEILSNNIDFLEIKNGYIDLSNMSNANQIYLESENREWLWLSLSSPKFLHEFPIILPSEYIYRPYEADFREVVTLDNDLAHKVKADVTENSQNQVYVDMNGRLREKTPLWKRIIRPVVLSDVFNGDIVEDNTSFLDNVDMMREATINAADKIEEFRLFLIDYTTDKKFDRLIKECKELVDKVHTENHKFMDNYYMEYDDKYEKVYNRFMAIIDTIIEDGYDSTYLHEASGSSNNFFDIAAECIFYIRDLCDEYNVLRVADAMPQRVKVVFEDILDNRIRFQRPIDVEDIWTFEFDPDTYTWKPYPLNVEYHFPDVYIFSDPNKEIKDRIFKAFIFYSDTINILETSREHKEASPDWSEDVDEYYHDQAGTYRDIFMEKFYWMGIRSIYKGILRTNSRFEVVEYVIDNPSYNRFNELFVNTLDPYFKMGLATYLKSDNLNFPLDEDISKLKEAIDQQFLGYNRVTSFEQYLENDWIPSYFDYVIKILDNWNYTNRLIRRPKNVFDINRLLPIINKTQTEVYQTVRNLNSDTVWILEQLEKYDYGIDVNNILKLLEVATEMNDNMKSALNSSLNLDIEIYSISDIEKICDLLKKHFDFTKRIKDKLTDVMSDVNSKYVAQEKKQILSDIKDISIALKNQIDDILKVINTFDIDTFLKATNDLNTYIRYDKENPDDVSLIGDINKFEQDWPYDIKDARNKLFISSTVLIKYTLADKSYTTEEIDEFKNQISETINDLNELEKLVSQYYITKENNFNPEILSKFYYVNEILQDWKLQLDEYLNIRDLMVLSVGDIKDKLNILYERSTNDYESNLINSMKLKLTNIIDDVSYILGDKDKYDAYDNYSEFNKLLVDYMGYTDHEIEVFETILRLGDNPPGYVAQLLLNQELLEAAIKYMESLDEVYIPNSEAANFSNVYKTDAVELIEGGFNHKVGDIVFIPDIGVYKINQVDGNICIATIIERLPYYNTSINNPLWNENKFEGITNGEGIGVKVRPIHVETIKIINDNAILPLVTEAENYYYILVECLNNPNKHNNYELRSTLDSLEGIISKWYNLKKIYSEYMSSNSIKYIDTLCDTISKLRSSCQPFMDERASIFVDDYIDALWQYILDIYNYADKNNLQDDAFIFYDDKVRNAYLDLKEFYSNGTKWNDASELSNLISKCNSEVNTIYDNLLTDIVLEDHIGVFTLQRDDIISKGNEIKSLLSTISEKAIPAKSYVSHLYDVIRDTPELVVDEMYSISNPGIAENGYDFKVGDIVSITTEKDDVLLFQVVKAEFGNVLNAVPLIKYALDYDPSGIYDANTEVGMGYNLKLNVRSHKIELSDSTILNDKGKQNIEPFDENDMLLFTFENAHDLDIGYEVFIGGVQTIDYVLRHEQNPNRLESNAIDAIYVNANKVIELKNASVQIPAEDYYEYYIDNVEIKDGGKGYSEGQTIVVGTDNQALQLIVDEVDLPLKGIQKISYGDISLKFAPDNPSVYNKEVCTDDMNNIDDEYNKDELNNDYMHHIVVHEDDKFGDPDYGYMIGQQSNETLTQRIENVIDPIDGIIKDSDRLPPDVYDLDDIQEVARVLIHDSTDIQNTDVNHKGMVKNNCIIKGDITVPDFAHLPKYVLEYPNGKVGSKVIVEHDETHHGHRMLYRIRTFVAYGYFVYDKPEVADYKWNTVDIKWNDTDCYEDLPSLSAIYPSSIWDSAKSYREIEEAISDKKIQNIIPDLTKNYSTYIDNFSIDDICVFNHTTKEWEDLSSDNWNIDINNDPENNDCGFVLTYNEDGNYSYDMSLYLKKDSDNQTRNSKLKQNAVVDVKAIMGKHIQKPSVNHPVNIGRRLTFRKLFPYYQKEKFTIGKLPNGEMKYDMDFKLSPYIHFRNEIHLEDIKIFNKSANRLEDILDTRLFEVRFKDDRCVQRGFETNTEVLNSYVLTPGDGFIDGEVWGYNEEFDTHVFGHVTTVNNNEGNIATFVVDHFVNPPADSIPLEFMIYQSSNQLDTQAGTAVIEFHTERKEVFGDGYIHNVVNPYAPIPKEFKVIVQYDLDDTAEYEIYIDMRPRKWKCKMPIWINGPEIFLEGVNIQKDRMYILTEMGRFPLVNPSTGKPSFTVSETPKGTLIKFLNLYKRYEELEIHTVPYPMRSVYTQRTVPSHGYINLEGKLNKPLNKKYYEFWMNGKLLTDEVSIVSPTKLFLHGLTSLKNFEIIEINRDPYEFFSESFLTTSNTRFNHPYVSYNYRTYLDDVLEGKLKGDNYKLEEQEYLLTPVWTQVDTDDPNYLDYPPNVDTDPDILSRNTQNESLDSIGDVDFQYVVTDVPTIEGVSIASPELTFKHFGFSPITDNMIVDITREEWANEIENDPYFESPTVITNEEWYGMVAKLFNEYGDEVYELNESAYKIMDDNVLAINKKNKLNRIMQRTVKYDI